MHDEYCLLPGVKDKYTLKWEASLDDHELVIYGPGGLEITVLNPRIKPFESVDWGVAQEGWECPMDDTSLQFIVTRDNKGGQPLYRLHIGRVALWQLDPESGEMLRQLKKKT